MVLIGTPAYARRVTSDRAVIRGLTPRLALMVCGVVVALASPPVPAHAAPGSIPEATIGFDGPVYAIARSADRIYLGGSFSRAGAVMPFGVAFSTATGLPNTAYPKPTGAVRAVVADGAGGYYIGGDFTGVGGVARHRIAHITAAGTVDAFDPDVDGPVYALALSGGTLYAGGRFTTVNGDQRRNRLAAFDTKTGSATAFDPDVNPGATSWVSALAVSGTTVYAGGTFATVNIDDGRKYGTARSRLAAFDAATGTAKAFNPNIGGADRSGGSVDALAVSGKTVYAAGFFNRVDVDWSVLRNNVAAFDAVTGKPTAFNPDPSVGSRASALVLSGTTLYVGGQTSGSRSWLRAYDTTKPTGNTTPFAVDFSGRLRALAMSGNTLYVGGRFDSLGGRANVAAFDTTHATPTVTAFAPPVYGEVGALAASGTTLYAGGPFRFAGSPPEIRTNLAVLDATTGRLTADAPSANGTVYALQLSGGNLFAGGQFDKVNGDTQRKNLAAFDTASGSATEFNPDVRCQDVNSLGRLSECESAVYALAASGGTVFAGGRFDGPNNVHNTTTRINAAGFDSATGIPTDFNPRVEGIVRALAVSGSTVYAGGRFTNVNQGGDRRGVAAFNASDGVATPFDPRIDRTVRALVVSGSTLYAGGDFTAVNGTTPRSTLAAFDTATGKATAFKPETTGPVNALALIGGTLYAGGSFTNVNGNLLRYRLAAFDTGTGSATAFDPTLNDSVFALDGSDGRTLYAGGAFTGAGGGTAVGSLAHFTERTVLGSRSPNTSTRLRLRSSSARLLSRSRGVRVAWRTGSVTSTAGFHVRRSRRVRGTIRQVRLTRRVMRVRRVRTGYAFTDRGGRRGDVYTITSVHRDGRRSVHPRIRIRG